jgi:hypothetical protein
MYFAEVALRARRADWSRRLLAYVGMTVGLACGLLGGHPETIFYGACLLGAYLAFRIVAQGSWADRISHTVAFALAGTVALALAAVQVIPFIEYLVNSQMLVVRSAGHGFGSFATALLPTHVFPGLLGIPSTTYNPVAHNYQEGTSSYVGLTILFLAGIAAATLPLHRCPAVLFFACVAGFWIVYVYNVAGLGAWIHAIPLFGLGAITRTHVLWTFSVSCLAAFGFHLLAVGTVRPPRPFSARATSYMLAPALVLGFGLILLFLSLDGARLLLAQVSRDPQVSSNLSTEASQNALRSQVVYLVATFSVVVIALVVLCAVRHGAHRWSLPSITGALIALVVFLQTGYMMKDHNPTISAEYFYPISRSLSEALRVIGDEQSLFLGPVPRYGAVNLVYGFRSITSNDAMWVRNFMKPYTYFLDDAYPYEGPNVRPRSLRAMQVMGLQYILMLISFRSDLHHSLDVSATGNLHTWGPRAGSR